MALMIKEFVGYDLSSEAKKQTSKKKATKKTTKKK